MHKPMLGWAPSAVLWGVFQQNELDTVLTGSGHTDIADDVLTLGRMNLERWSKLDGKVAFTKDKAERAIVVGQALLKALGERGDADSEDVRKAKDEWERSFTLLTNAYAEVESAVTYVRRHHGDATDYAPSIFSTRKAGRKPAQATPDTTTPAPRVS